MCERCPELEARIAALAKYADHHYTCYVFSDLEGPRSCTCGLADLLSTPSPTGALDAVVEKAVASRLEGLAPKLIEAGKLLEAWFQTRADFPVCPTYPMAQWLIMVGNKIESDHAAGLGDKEQEP